MKFSIPILSKKNRLLGCIAGIILYSVASSHASGSIGHWKIVNIIDFNNISKTNLKGDIKPEYQFYAVTMTGFHTDTFGITIGPDDDVRCTNDAGKSWYKAPSDVNCRHGLDIVDRKTAWHTGNGGTRVTIDGGKNWKTVKPSAYPYLSFLDNKNGWAASPFNLQKTIDGGESWTDIKLPSDIQAITSIDLVTIKNGYVLDTTGNLFFTNDAGQNWKVCSINLGKNEQLITTKTPFAAMRFFDNLHGLVVFDLPDGTVWFTITIDGGKTWQRAEIPELRNKSCYFKLYLSRDGQLLTATDDFQGKHVSIVMRYQQS